MVPNRGSREFTPKSTFSLQNLTVTILISMYTNITFVARTSPQISLLRTPNITFAHLKITLFYLPQNHLPRTPMYHHPRGYTVIQGKFTMFHTCAHPYLLIPAQSYQLSHSQLPCARMSLLRTPKYHFRGAHVTPNITFAHLRITQISLLRTSESPYFTPSESPPAHPYFTPCITIRVDIP